MLQCYKVGVIVGVHLLFKICFQEAERSFRGTVGELEEEVRSLQEKLKSPEINGDNKSKHLLMVDQEVMGNEGIR